MSCLHYDSNHDHELSIENVSLVDVAKQYATPCYVYSRAAIERHWLAFDTALHLLPHRVCYAVKANANLAILRLLARLGAGFDIVSVGELERVLMAGGDPKSIVFSGVGKTTAEIQRAIAVNIDCFNVESEPELQRLQEIASKNHCSVNIALRVNPQIDSQTHSHVATGRKGDKFGIECTNIIPLCKQLASYPWLNLIGIACHIGSQLTQIEPLQQAAENMLGIYQQLRQLGISIQRINMGGGLGICYQNETPPTVADYAKMLMKIFAPYPVEMILEPGRVIIGPAGILLTRVEYIKHSSQKTFAIIDAGMNDLIRPALYNAQHAILPVAQRHTEKNFYAVAGPVCESADVFAKHCELAIQPGDLLAIDSVGAYGFSMSSNYNSRCRAAEILVDGSEMHLIRRRERVTDSTDLEMMID